MEFFERGTPFFMFVIYHLLKNVILSGLIVELIWNVFREGSQIQKLNCFTF